MVVGNQTGLRRSADLSVLALSSRFDGLPSILPRHALLFLSVLALSSRFDGQKPFCVTHPAASPFSTRSVESF